MERYGMEVIFNSNDLLSKFIYGEKLRKKNYYLEKGLLDTLLKGNESWLIYSAVVWCVNITTTAKSLTSVFACKRWYTAQRKLECYYNRRQNVIENTGARLAAAKVNSSIKNDLKLFFFFYVVTWENQIYSVRLYDIRLEYMVLFVYERRKTKKQKL